MDEWNINNMHISLYIDNDCILQNKSLICMSISRVKGMIAQHESTWNDMVQII